MSDDDATGDLQPLTTHERPTAPVPPGVREDMLPERAEFPTTRLRRGYDVAQVDALIDAVLDAVRSGGRAPVIAKARFRGTVGLRRGYDERTVDDYLDRLAEVVGQEPTPEPAAGKRSHAADGDPGPDQPGEAGGR